MCLARRWIDPHHHAPRSRDRCALTPSLLFLTIFACAALSANCRFAHAEQPPPAFAQAGVPTPPQPVRQATYTEPELPRAKPNNYLSPAGADKPIPLAAPPGDGSYQHPTSGPSTFGALVSVAGSLAVVLGLFLMVAWFMRRGLPNNAGKRLPSEVVEVLGRAPLANRQQMQVLRFGNKLLLVCLSPSGVDTLAEITDPL